MKDSSNEILQNKRWRAITYDWDVLSSYGNTSRAYCLTDFQVAWLLSNIDYMAWSSRWENCPCSESDLQAMQGELAYNLMDCIDLQPYQLQYLYDSAQSAELDRIQELWDANPTPSAVNPNTPDDFYNGDNSDDRNNALCTACKIYVYSYAQNWVQKAQIALGIVAVVGLFASITVVGGVIASVLIGGLAYITSIALDAMQDTDALDAVACCLKDGLEGQAITNANWLTALNGCGFTSGTNEAIVRDIIASDLGVFKNWLTFINQLGNSFVLAENGIFDCPCAGTGWTYASDFPVSQSIWSIFSNSFGTRGTWAPTTGYSSSNTRVSTFDYMRIIDIQTSEFTPTTIYDVVINFDLTKGSIYNNTTAIVLIQATKSDNTTVSLIRTRDSMTNGNGQELTLNVNLTNIKRLRVSVRSSIQTSASYSGIAKLNSVTVTGDNTNPF